MATFKQFYLKHPAYCSHYYVCGAESVLVEDVVGLVLEMMEPDPQAFVTVDVAQSSESAAKMALFQETPLPVKTVLLRNVQRIKNWTPIVVFLKQSGSDSTRLICVSDEERPDTKQEHFRAFLDSKIGQFVICHRMDDLDRMTDYVSVICPMLSEETVDYLVEQFEEDFLGLRNVCNQLQLFKKITSAHVRLISDSAGLTTVVYSLFENRKADALRAAMDVTTPREIAAILAHLEREIRREIFVVDALRRGLRGYELFSHSGVPKSALSRILARVDRERVDLERFVRRLVLVGKAALLVDKGETIGVLEKLISEW